MKHASTPLFVRALLCTSLVLTLPACMVQPGSHHASVSFPSSSAYMGAHYVQPKSRYAIQPTPVLYAQANTSPPVLRGLSQEPSQTTQAYAQDSYYTDYQSAPNITSTIAKPVFQHHLDEGGYQTSPREGHGHMVAPYTAAQSYAPPTYVSSSAHDSYQIYEAYPTYDAQVQSRQIETVGTTETVNPSEQSLGQSLGAAVHNSPRLAIEDLKIQEAQEALTQAKSQGRFKLNLSGVAGPSQRETVFSVVDRTDSDFNISRGANLDLSLPIYQGGRVKALKKVAEVGIKEAEANFDVVETSVAQDAALAHFNVIRDRKLIKIYERNVQLLNAQKTTVSALLQAGENTVTDQALIDARLASIEVSLEQAHASLAASESTYKKLVGRPAPDLLPAQSIALPDNLDEIKATAQKNNPQIKAVQTRAEAAYHNIAVAKSFGRPKLALQGVLRAAEGQSETIRRNSAAEVLLNLTVPILSGGENKSRVRQAALAQSRAVLENRALRDNLNERIEQLWASVQSARRSQGPNRAQIKAAQKAYDAISKQRDAGVATSLDVQSVEQTLLDAQLNLIQAQNTENVSRFQLLSLMGSL